MSTADMVVRPLIISELVFRLLSRSSRKWTRLNLRFILHDPRFLSGSFLSPNATVMRAAV